MVEEVVEARQVEGGGAGGGAFKFPDLDFVERILILSIT